MNQGLPSSFSRPVARRTLIAGGLGGAVLAGLGLDGAAVASSCTAGTPTATSVIIRYRFPFPLTTTLDRYMMRSGIAGCHRGVDYSLGTSGLAIPNVADGTFVRTFLDASLGRVVVIKHSDGKYSWYCHMVDSGYLNVPAGTAVPIDTTVGTVGGTGGVGAHLHHMLSNADSSADGNHFDPVPYITDRLNASGGSLGIMEEELAYAIEQNVTTGVPSYQMIAIYGGGVKNGWFEIAVNERGKWNVFRSVTDTQAFSEGRGQRLDAIPLSVDATAWDVMKEIYYKP